MQLDIILNAHAFDEVLLLFEPIDMLFFAVEDVGEQLTADIVADRFAIGDGFAQQGNGVIFECEVGGQDFLHRLTHAQAAEQFRALGFTRVSNVTGGIDAWAQDVDNGVPRY